MFNQHSIIIMYVGRNFIQISGGGLTGIVTMQFPETIIKDLDVISIDAAYVLIKQWVKQYALSGYQLVIILSEAVYFEKLFSLKEQPQVESDVLKFFDMVPFELIWSKVYSTEKGKHAVAINKSLYDTLHQGFSLQGVHTKAVIPAFALGTLSTKRSLDTELVEYVLKNLDALIKQSLLDSQELAAPVALPPSEELSGTPKKKSQLPLLLGVFGILILILVIVVALQYR